MLALLVQTGMPDSVAVTGEPNPYVLFNGRRLSIVHLTTTTVTTGDNVHRGDTLGTFGAPPTQISTRHQTAIDSARILYQRRQFEAAAALLQPVYRDERDNLLVADEYARSLFWIDARKDEAFDVYHRLIEQLDRQSGTNDRQVAVDAWFRESYWKIGNLYLDRQNWEPAAFEITRFLAVSGGASNDQLSQVYTYLAEAYVHLGRRELARWGGSARASKESATAEAAMPYLIVSRSIRVFIDGSPCACSHHDSASGPGLGAAEGQSLGPSDGVFAKGA